MGTSALHTRVLDWGQEGSDAMNTHDDDRLMPPVDKGEEPTDANPVPLSPTDPKRRTAEKDAPGMKTMPGVVAPMSQGAPIGAGVGTVPPVVAPVPADTDSTRGESRDIEGA
jgi:hypothetical protein